MSVRNVYGEDGSDRRSRMGVRDASPGFVWFQSRRRVSRDVNEDEFGLSLLAYAFGEAVTVEPIVLLIIPITSSATTEAKAGIELGLAAS